MGKARLSLKEQPLVEEVPMSVSRSGGFSLFWRGGGVNGFNGEHRRLTRQAVVVEIARTACRAIGLMPARTARSGSEKKSS